MNTLFRLMLILVVLTVCSPTEARMLDEVPQGTPVIVVLSSGDLHGTLRGVDSDYLKLTTDEGSKIRLPLEDVKKVLSRDKKGDSLKNGVLTGAAVGFGSGFVIGGAWGAAMNESPSFNAKGTLSFGLIAAGIGAAVGLAVDATHKGHEVLYDRRSYAELTGRLAQAPVADEPLRPESLRAFSFRPAAGTAPR